MMEWLGQEWDYAAWSDSTKEAAIFGTVEECVGKLRAQLAAGVQKLIGTRSQYFRLSSLITIGSVEFNLYSLLYQDGQNAGGVRPILRSFTQD